MNGVGEYGTTRPDPHWEPVTNHDGWYRDTWNQDYPPIDWYGRHILPIHGEQLDLTVVRYRHESAWTWEVYQDDDHWASGSTITRDLAMEQCDSIACKIGLDEWLRRENEKEVY